MKLSHPKIKFLVGTACVDSDNVYNALKDDYPLLPYCGYYEVHKVVWLFVQHRNRLSSEQICHTLSELKPPVHVKKISKYSKVEGVLLDGSGTLPVRGRKRASSSETEGANSSSISNAKGITSSTKSIVAVNPFGHESTKHISQEYMQNLLSAPKITWQVLEKFAEELYVFEENMNFRLRIKERYIKIRIGDDGAWRTCLKLDQYEMIFENVVRLYSEAVNTFKDSIPEDDLVRSENMTDHLESNRQSISPESKVYYEIYAKNTVNIIGENISEMVKRKKLELV